MVVKFPLMAKKNHWGQVCVITIFEWRPIEAIIWSCEGDFLETPRCWICWSCRIPIKESCFLGMDPAQEKVCCSQQRRKRSWRSEKCFGIRHAKAEFGVCPTAFQSCIGPVCPHYAPFPPIWNGNAYCVPLYVGHLCDQLFSLILQGIT